MKVYHHNDADGRCSGAILYRALAQYPDFISVANTTINQTGQAVEGVATNKAKFIEVDFTDPINVEEILSGERIYILDYSFKPDIMEKVLEKTKNITWIDHHKTSFEYNYADKIDTVLHHDKSACMLSWEYFYEGKPAPPSVELIQAWDIWNHGFSKYVEPFHEGLALYPHTPNSGLWKELLDVNNTRWLEIVKHGLTCVKYRDMKNAEYISSFAFEVTFEGYKCLACGNYGYGSKLFGERYGDYDMVIPFEYNGNVWTIGLYTTKDNIDCSEIAKKFGGGGHKQAAGFTIKDMPMFLRPPASASEVLAG